MSDASVILRDVYGPNAAKKIARKFGVAVITAKVWLAGRFPESRTQELAAAVREELNRLDARNKQIREQLGIGDAEAGDFHAGGKAGGGAPRAAAGPMGAATPGMGGEIGHP